MKRNKKNDQINIKGIGMQMTCTEETWLPYTVFGLPCSRYGEHE